MPGLERVKGIGRDEECHNTTPLGRNFGCVSDEVLRRFDSILNEIQFPLNNIK